MPSHIYSMVGMWEASIAPNLASLAVAKEYAEKSKLDGALAGVPHAYDFMQYAYLQLGQDAKAKAVIEENAAIQKVVGPQLVRMGQAAYPLATCSSGRTGRGRRGSSRSVSPSRRKKPSPTSPAHRARRAAVMSPLHKPMLSS